MVQRKLQENTEEKRMVLVLDNMLLSPCYRLVLAIYIAKRENIDFPVTACLFLHPTSLEEI